MDQSSPSAGGQPVVRRGSPTGVAIGGFVRAIGFAAGLLVLGIVFLAGLMIGALTVAAGSMAETAVLYEPYREGGRDTVAILPVQGPIDGAQAEQFRLFADRVLDDSTVKAIVLRVDSPGGGVTASDEIWYQVRRLKDAGLPVVASFGSVAASGGYYVSCGADQIVAEPTCITGSIGVIAQTFILTNLMDKVGIEPVTLMASDSPEKDLGNPFRPWTEADHARFVAMLDAAYDIFNDRVREGRSDVISDPARIDELADGSIFTAAQALEVGLVDSVGYLADAIGVAEQAAGLPADSARVVLLYEPATLLDDLLGARASRVPAALQSAETLRTWMNDLGSPRLMYLMR